MRHLWLPIVLFLAVSLPHLDQGDFRRDTGLYAAVGHWMWETGQLATPHYHPERPYFNKPPLAILLHGLSLKAGGRDNLVAARLPSVFAGCLIVLLTASVARRLTSEGVALTSGIVLALSYDFFRRTHEISLDLWQLVFIMLAVLWTVTGLEAKRSVVWFLGAGASLGLALLCKPLVALVLIPIVALWMAFDRRPRQIVPFVAASALGALLTGAPWHLYMAARFDQDFLSVYFGNQIAGRMAGDHGSGPFYYYLLMLVNYTWPWIIALVLGLLAAIRGKLDPASRRLFLLGGVWCAVVLPALSVFTDKQPNYALPLFPPLAWICALGLHALGPGPFARWRDRGYPWLWVPALVGALTATLLPWRSHSGEDPDWRGIADTVARERIDPSMVAGGRLQPKEIAAYYVFTGAWPIVADGSPLEAAIVRKRVFRWDHPVIFEGERFILFRPD